MINTPVQISHKHRNSFVNFAVPTISLLLLVVSFQPIKGQRIVADTNAINSLFRLAEGACYNNLSSTRYHLAAISDLACQDSPSNYEIRAHIKEASCALYFNELELVLHNLEKAKSLLKFLPDNPDKSNLKYQVSNIYGDYYLQRGQYTQAIATNENIIEQLQKKRQGDGLSDNEFGRLIVAFLYLAEVQKRSGAYEAALESLNYAIDYEKEHAKELGRPARIGSTYSRLAEVYRLQGKLEDAKELFQQSREFYQGVINRGPPQLKRRLTKYIVRDYHGLARINLSKEDLSQVKSNIETSLQYHTPSDPIYGETLSILGNYYEQKGDSTRAEEYYTEALNHYRTNSEVDKSQAIVKACKRLGDFYKEKSDLRRALSAYQEGIIAAVRQFDESNYHKNPSFEQDILFGNELIGLLHRKVDALYHLSEISEPQAQDTLQGAAWGTGALAIDLLDSLRFDRYSEADQYQLVTENYALFELMLRLGQQVPETKPEELFRVIEKAKAAVLVSSLNQTSILQQHTKNRKEQFEELHAIKFQVQEAEKELFNAEEAKVDSLRLQTLRNQLFDLNHQYTLSERALRKTVREQIALGSTGPDYSLRYLQENVIEADQTLISYFLGEQSLYAFLIKPDTFFLQELGYQDRIKAFASTFNDDIYYKRDSEYIAKASYLHSILIAPLLEHLSSKRLIFVPDGVLAYVPFELLLDQAIPTETNYKSYPYLGKRFQISYAFSANSLPLLRANKTKVRSVLAIAPSYRKLPKEFGPLASRGLLDTLLYNQEEALMLKAKLGAHLLIDTTANKEKFLDQLSHCQVLHLATHGILNRNHPDYSFLAFSNLIDTVNREYKLYVQEIANLEVALALAVLSACETGTGSLQQGEGTMSLARAFMLAGTKSIVASLWEVDDKATKQLMEYFYEGLNKGRTKDGALQWAKQQYLFTADNFEAHPRYWAAMTAIGNMENIEFVNQRRLFDLPIWLWALLLTGIIGLYLGRDHFRLSKQ